MKRLNPELGRYLRHWGDWRIKGVAGLGYPSMTMEQRNAESPGRSGGPAMVPNYWPDLLGVEVQNAITRIGDFQLQNVLWCQYVQQMKSDRAALAMGVPAHEYLRLLDKAHKAIADILNMKVWIYTR